MKLFLIGGFLGSGKTTAIVNACEQLLKENLKIAVITNDQGEELVDSAFVKSFTIPVRQVTNGCFCCNYHQLDEHIQSFFESGPPDVIFAESVGSCTDLVATIAKPLAKFRPELTVVISVFVDVPLFLSMIEGKSTFLLDDQVKYIYYNQLKEGDVLIMNKTDLVSAEQLARINNEFVSFFPSKKIIYQNSLKKDDVNEWLLTIRNYQQPLFRQSLNIDYGIYGEGEAKLAWVDKRISITAIDGKAASIAEKIIGDIYDIIQQNNLTIGHLKFFIETEKWRKKISFTTSGGDPTVVLGQEKIYELQMLINARIQTDPQLLKKIIAKVLQEISDEYSCDISVKHLSAFKPGFPQPTHRFANSPLKNLTNNLRKVLSKNGKKKME